MNRKLGSIFLVLTFAGSLLAGCAQAQPEEEQPETAVTVEAIEGTDLSTVTLTDDSALRLGIETAAVEAGQTGGVVVPYASVLYDANGDTWVFTTPENLVYVRAPIAVDAIDGDRAILSDGPDPGTLVVIVGVAELSGAEQGVGDPE